MKHSRWIAALCAVLLCLTAVAPAWAEIIEETEPNDTIATARVIEPGNKYQGAIDKPKDEDYFELTATSARTIEVTLKQWGFRTSVKVLRNDKDSVCSNRVLFGKLGTRAESLKFKVRVNPGKYYIVLSSKRETQRGRYELSIRDVGSAKPGVKLPASMRMTKGYEYEMEVSAVPSYFLPPTVTYKSSNRRVAVVEAESGFVRALRNGVTTITATTTDGRKTSCRVTVGGNGFKRAEPLFGTEKKLYASTKAMYYTSGKLIVDVFILNKTGKSYAGKAAGLSMSIFDKKSGMKIYTHDCGTWKPDGGTLRNGRAQVVHIEVPESKLPVLDVGSKRHYVVLTLQGSKVFEQIGKP